MSRDNPFYYNLPVLPSDFVGRWSLVDEIVADLHRARPDSWAIIGGRRFGKSSVLKAIEARLLESIPGYSESEGYEPNLEEESSGVPSNFYSQLRIALLDCGPFASNSGLNAIFVDKRLSPWQNQLPQANNPAERVERVVNFLHNKFNNVGENALVLLLRVLSERLDPEDVCHQRLVDLANEFDGEIRPGNYYSTIRPAPPKRSEVSTSDRCIVPLVVDLNQCEMESARTVYASIINLLNRALHKILSLDAVLNKTRFRTLSGDRVEELSFTGFQDVIEDLACRVEGHCGSLRLVLLLDEIEVVTRFSWWETLFNQLRALIYNSHLANTVKLVLAGSARVIKVRQAGSPLLNMVKIVHLKAFSEIALRELIARGGEMPPDAMACVQAWSGGHPFIAQYLLHHLWTDGLDRITPTAVERVAHQMRQRRAADLRGWWEAIGDSGQQAYVHLVKINTWVNEGKLLRQIQDVGQSLDMGLAALCYHGLVVQDENRLNRYRVAGTLFQDWYLQNIAKVSPGEGTTAMVEPWPDPHQLVGQKLSQYKITGYLGRGGMGYVYKGRQTSLERDVAIKMMLPHLASDPKFGARFRRESHAVANLDHPHIVQIYDFGQEGGMYYMVMPYIPGGTLKTYLEDFKARDARVPVDAIVRILTQVGSALQHAHENGVLHRDIKPGNVMLYSVNQVVLTDFGLAKIVGSDLSTSSSNPFGTIAYMAPEQFEDASSVDQRADIYALGITLYEMAAGRVPFEGSPVKVMNQHLKVQPPDLRQFRDDLPDVIIRLIEKALAKDPAKRFQTVRAMLDALKA